MKIRVSEYTCTFYNRAFLASFSGLMTFICAFDRPIGENYSSMVGFKPQTFGRRSGRSTNCATTKIKRMKDPESRGLQGTELAVLASHLAARV